MSSVFAGTKRAAPQPMQQLANNPKVPKASEVELVVGPKPQASARRLLPASAPVDVCMYKVTDQAGDVWEQFAGQDVPLWQVQINHAAQRMITFQMRDSFTDYLAEEHHADDALPKSVKELEENAGIRLIVSDTKDPENVGFIQWRVAFYVAADDLSNFLYLLDKWFVYKAKQMPRDHPFQVHFHPHVNVDVAEVWNHLQYVSLLSVPNRFQHI